MESVTCAIIFLLYIHAISGWERYQDSITNHITSKEVRTEIILCSSSLFTSSYFIYSVNFINSKGSVVVTYPQNHAYLDRLFLYIWYVLQFFCTLRFSFNVIYRGKYFQPDYGLKMFHGTNTLPSVIGQKNRRGLKKMSYLLMFKTLWNLLSERVKKLAASIFKFPECLKNSMFLQKESYINTLLGHSRY